MHNQISLQKNFRHVGVLEIGTRSLEDKMASDQSFTKTKNKQKNPNTEQFILKNTVVAELDDEQESQ